MCGVMLGKVSDTGRIITGDDQFALIIDQVKRGVANARAKNLHCFPDIPRVKKKDVVTLQQLVGKPERRGPGKPENLKPIQECDRYKGKINWEEKREDIKDCRITKAVVKGQRAALGVGDKSLKIAS